MVPAGARRDRAARPLSSPPAMPRDWSDVFLLADGDAAAATADAGPEQRRGFFRRLRENLSKTRVALQAEVQATLFETLDDETWERLEEALIMADVGATTTAKVVAQLEQEAESGEVEGGEALTRAPRRAAGRPRARRAKAASTCATSRR